MTAEYQRKIIVGAGGTRQPGWVSYDQSKLDVLRPESWARHFQPGTLLAVVAEHVWEHLTPQDGLRAAHLVNRYLAPGGRFRLAVPDGCHPDPRYIAWVRPGTGYNGDDHRALYDYRSLTRMLDAADFRVRLLEWWNEIGEFNRRFWLSADGRIYRCDGSLWSQALSLRVGARYTSLIVDALKQ